MMPEINGAMLAVSSSLAASIVAKATVTTALALIGARLARRSRAAVRHALLAAAFGVLLVLPVASIVAPPVRIAVPVATQTRPCRLLADGVIGAIRAVAPADAASASRLQLRDHRRFRCLLCCSRDGSPGRRFFCCRWRWVCGKFVRCAGPACAWPHGQSVANSLALEAGIHRRVEVLLHEALPGPMTCGVVHPAIVLPLDAQTWEAEDLNRAMVHELEHVRRGDWVSHCLARAVCAVYWFHPLVWIAWRQLALEAERACDDAVLGRSEATAYADQLVGLARRLSTAKSPAAGDGEPCRSGEARRRGARQPAAARPGGGAPGGARMRRRRGAGAHVVTPPDGCAAAAIRRCGEPG